MAFIPLMMDTVDTTPTKEVRVNGLLFVKP